MDANANRREFSRSPVHIEVRLTAGTGNPILGTLRDISIKGVFLATDTLAPIGSTCQVLLLLEGGAESIRAEAQGKVVRSDAAGIAIEFTETDPDSLAHLHKLVLYNAPDTDKAEQEIADSVGLHRQESLEDF